MSKLGIEGAVALNIYESRIHLSYDAAVREAFGENVRMCELCGEPVSGFGRKWRPEDEAPGIIRTFQAKEVTKRLSRDAGWRGAERPARTSND